MVIQWLGQSCFKIHGKGDGGKEITIVIDPFDAKVTGLSFPTRCPADILLSTHNHPDHHALASISGNPFVIEHPGEYETKGVFIYGIPAWHDAKDGAEQGGMTLYYGEIEGLSFVHLGAVGHRLNERQLEIVEDAHIAFVPVGGKTTLNSVDAAAVVNQIEPRIVIPMHYALPKLKTAQDPVENFLKEMGVSGKERVQELRVTTKDLPQEEVQIVVFEPVS